MLRYNTFSNITSKPLPHTDLTVLSYFVLGRRCDRFLSTNYIYYFKMTTAIASVGSKIAQFSRKYPIVRGMVSYGLIWPGSSLIQQTVDGKTWSIIEDILFYINNYNQLFILFQKPMIGKNVQDIVFMDHALQHLLCIYG